MNKVEIIEQREILGKDFKIYGTFENPLFLAKDVANWIEHKKPSEMIQNIDEDEKVKIFIYPSDNIDKVFQSNTEYWFLTEDGLYEVLMQSRKPIAKVFKKEVKQILKSIRKNGFYGTPQKIEEILNDPRSFLKTLEAYAEEKEKNKILQLENNELKEENKILENKNGELILNNKVLSEEILTWDNRAVLNSVIRKLSPKLKKSFSSVWSIFYRELLYKHGINLKTRGKSPYIQHIKEIEWAKVLSTLVAICEDNDVNFAEIINKEFTLSS